MRNKSQCSWFIQSMVPFFFFLNPLLSLYQLYCGDHVKRAQSDRAELKRRLSDMEQRLRHERQSHRDATSGEAARSPNPQLDSLLIRRDKGSPWGLGGGGCAKGHVCQG